MLHDLLDIKTARILIVDDDQVDLELIRNVLIKNDFNNVSITQNFQKGLEYYQNNITDIILLCIENTAFNPIEKIKAFSFTEYNLNPPLLVMSTCNEKKYRLNLLSNGAKDFICKPLDLDELLIKIRNFLEMHLMHKEIDEHNKTLDRIVKTRTNELLATQKEIIERLGIASEYKDTDTGWHTKRVGHYAECLAKTMGFNEDVCEDLLLGAPLHDIGKIGVPDKILLKPGKLDPDEWKIMQQHTSIGFEILKGSKSRLLKNAEIIALTHHERWDGQGYPQGLKNIETHWYGRITAIADVYDALTMNRPYKKAWSDEDAIELINNGRGTQFDPELVDAFNSVKDEIIAIKHKLSDLPKG